MIWTLTHPAYRQPCHQLPILGPQQQVLVIGRDSTHGAMTTPTQLTELRDLEKGFEENDGRMPMTHGYPLDRRSSGVQG